MSPETFDSMTVLTCVSSAAIATKQFTALDDGTIRKDAYNAGREFKYEEIPILGLDGIANMIESLKAKPKKFIIRGKPKDGAGLIVRRKIHGEGAAFEPCPRRWVMMDIDRRECPPHLDVTQHSPEIIQWIKSTLPEPFQNARCVFKFSSSQNVPERLGARIKQTVSVHLYFWCDRPLSEDEWKQYFKTNSCKVDLSIYTAVQPHYTASPIFRGMADPLPARIGIC